jgi:hypothetical protein
MTKSGKQFTAEKSYIYQDSIKDVQLQEKPLVLEREHQALQNLKFLNFILYLWVIFALLDPSPDPDSLT